MSVEFWAAAHRELGDAPCAHDASKLAIYCAVCVDRIATLIEREKALEARPRGLDNCAEELASTEENLEVWSDRLHGIEHDLKIREEAAELKESWLERVFRKR